MYYIHLQLDEGFFPRPEDIEQSLGTEIKGQVYISAYDRGIVVVYRNANDRAFIIENLKAIVHIAKVVYKRSTEYKYKINTTWRKQ